MTQVPLVYKTGLGQAALFDGIVPVPIGLGRSDTSQHDLRHNHNEVEDDGVADDHGVVADAEAVEHERYSSVEDANLAGRAWRRRDYGHDNVDQSGLQQAQRKVKGGKGDKRQ